MSYVLMYANTPWQALNDVPLRTYRLCVDKKEPLFGLNHDLKVQNMQFEHKRSSRRRSFGIKAAAPASYMVFGQRSGLECT